MKGFTKYWYLAFVPMAFACDRDHAESSAKQMFENAIRRDPTAEEATHVAKVLTGCTAFFVANSKQETLMITARHCMDTKPEDWCDGKTVLKDSEGNEGSCLEILATDASHDIFLFKSSLPYVESRSLLLAKNPPATKTPLLMIGHPADDSFDGHQGREGLLTVTENCWVLGNNYESPYLNSPSFQFKDAAALHNCSTYGGNSGGPMLIKGTNIVVGLPFTYFPYDYVKRSQNELPTAANMAQMSDFVHTFASVLAAHEVTLNENIPDAEPESNGGGFKPNPTIGLGPMMTRYYLYCAPKGAQGTGENADVYAFSLTVLNNHLDETQKVFYSDPTTPEEPVVLTYVEQKTRFSKPEFGFDYEFDFSTFQENAYPAVLTDNQNAGMTYDYVCYVYNSLK